jgi:hypothetical protein
MGGAPAAPSVAEEGEGLIPITGVERVIVLFTGFEIFLVIASACGSQKLSPKRLTLSVPDAAMQRTQPREGQ